MSIEKRLGLDTHPRPVYSGPKFHQSFLKFVSANTLRTQHEALEKLILSVSSIIIDDKTFSNIRRQSRHYYYVPLPHAIEINHLFRRKALHPAQNNSRAQYRLDRVFLRTPDTRQPTTVAYEVDKDSNLIAVRALNSQLSLFTRSTELDEPFEQMPVHTPILQTAHELRHYISEQALNGFVAVRGSVVDAFQPHLS